MDRREIQEVLTNWLTEATTPPPLPDAIAPAEWVATHFLRWWQPQIEDELSSAELAVSRTWNELESLGGWSNPQLGDALHELIHARDALSALREAFGFTESES